MMGRKLTIFFLSTLLLFQIQGQVYAQEETLQSRVAKEVSWNIRSNYPSYIALLYSVAWITTLTALLYENFTTEEKVEKAISTSATELVQGTLPITIVTALKALPELSIPNKLQAMTKKVKGIIHPVSALTLAIAALSHSVAKIIHKPEHITHPDREAITGMVMLFASLLPLLLSFQTRLIPGINLINYNLRSLRPHQMAALIFAFAYALHQSSLPIPAAILTALVIFDKLIERLIKRKKTTLRKVEPCGKNSFKMTIDNPWKSAKGIRPGDYAYISLPPTGLERPFSYAEVSETSLSFIISVQGKATGKLQQLMKDSVNGIELSSQEVTITHYSGGHNLLNETELLALSSGTGAAPTINALQHHTIPTIVHIDRDIQVLKEILLQMQASGGRSLVHFFLTKDRGMEEETLLISKLEEVMSFLQKEKIPFHKAKECLVPIEELPHVVLHQGRPSQEELEKIVEKAKCSAVSFCGNPGLSQIVRNICSRYIIPLENISFSL